MKILIGQKLKKIQWFDSLILLLSVFVVLPKNLFFLPFNGLDNSWILALNMAVNQHLIYGKDFFFNYGPLGFLFTGQVVFIHKIYVILFHLFLLGCLIFIIHYFIKQLKSRLSKVVFFLILFATSSSIYFERAFLLLLISLFFTLYYLSTRKRFSIFIVGFIALLSFYIKLNTGLILTALLLIFFAFLVIVKKEKPRFFIYFTIGYFAIILLLSVLLHVDLVGYLKASLDLINYYNDAVSLPAPINILVIIAAIIGLYLIIFLTNIKLIFSSKERLLIYFFIAFSAFLLFKEGFVRADVHMLVFFTNVIPLAGLLYFFENEQPLKKHLLIGIWVTTIFCLISVRQLIPQNNLFLQAYNQIASVPYKDFIFNEYPSRLKSAANYGKKSSKFPDRILDKLNGKSVDILPTDISYIYFNNLKYNPRPVIQSYAAYSEYLDGMNAKKYSSQSSPDYLLYAFGSIDYRHPFWDESATKLTMLTNYEINDTLHLPFINSNLVTNQDFILLNKRISPLKLVEIGSKSILYEIGDTLEIPKSDNLIYLYADFEYTLFGKIRRFLYQPNRLAAEIAYKGTGSPSYNIAIKPILKAGVLANKKVLTYDDAYEFFKTQGKNNIDFRSIRFTPKSLGIKDKAIITLKEFKIE